jgi:DNA-binding IclR family transcriptional regulator
MGTVLCSSLWRRDSTPASRRRSRREPRCTPPPRATRDGFQVQLEAVREDGFAADPGALDPAIACIAVPWPQLGFPSAIACLGSPGAIGADVALIRHVLALAAQPGSTPNQIITGAAAAVVPHSPAQRPPASLGRQRRE